MRRIALALALVTAASSAYGQNSRIVMYGHFWETSGFPPNQLGDRLFIAGTVGSLGPRFGIDFSAEEVTFVVRGLTSSGKTAGPGSVRIDYQPGANLEIYRDAAHDASFPANAPGEDLPPSFTNGTLLLEGTISSAAMFLDPTGVEGYYVFTLDFVGGSALPLVQHGSPTRSATITGEIDATNPFGGYAGSCAADLDFWLVGVQPATWAAAKALYR
jgi:hypothetical protein